METVQFQIFLYFKFTLSETVMLPVALYGQIDMQEIYLLVLQNCIETVNVFNILRQFCMTCTINTALFRFMHFFALRCTKGTYQSFSAVALYITL